MSDISTDSSSASPVESTAVKSASVQKRAEQCMSDTGLLELAYKVQDNQYPCNSNTGAVDNHTKVIESRAKQFFHRTMGDSPAHRSIFHQCKSLQDQFSVWIRSDTTSLPLMRHLSSVFTAHENKKKTTETKEEAYEKITKTMEKNCNALDAKMKDEKHAEEAKVAAGHLIKAQTSPELLRDKFKIYACTPSETGRAAQFCAQLINAVYGYHQLQAYKELFSNLLSNDLKDYDFLVMEKDHITVPLVRILETYVNPTIDFIKNRLETVQTDGGRATIADVGDWMHQLTKTVTDAVETCERMYINMLVILAGMAVLAPLLSVHKVLAGFLVLRVWHQSRHSYEESAFKKVLDHPWSYMGTDRHMPGADLPYILQEKSGFLLQPPDKVRLLFDNAISEAVEYMAELQRLSTVSGRMSGSTQQKVLLVLPKDAILPALSTVAEADTLEHAQLRRQRKKGEMEKLQRYVRDYGRDVHDVAPLQPLIRASKSVLENPSSPDNTLSTPVPLLQIGQVIKDVVAPIELNTINIPLY